MMSVATAKQYATQQTRSGDQKESCEVDRSAGREILLRSEGANDGVTGAELLCSLLHGSFCCTGFPRNFFSSQRVNWIDTILADVSNTYAACIKTGLGGP